MAGWQLCRLANERLAGVQAGRLTGCQVGNLRLGRPAVGKFSVGRWWLVVYQGDRLALVSFEGW